MFINEKSTLGESCCKYVKKISICNETMQELQNGIEWISWCSRFYLSMNFAQARMYNRETIINSSVPIIIKSPGKNEFQHSKISRFIYFCIKSHHCTWMHFYVIGFNWIQSILFQGKFSELIWIHPTVKSLVAQTDIYCFQHPGSNVDTLKISSINDADLEGRNIVNKLLNKYFLF